MAGDYSEGIGWEDLIKPDDSIKNLIAELEELNRTYGSMLETIKTSAKEVVNQLKAIGSATTEQRAQMNDAAIATDRLVRAQKELQFSLSETGKEVAWLKAQTTSNNKMSVEMKQQSEALVGSYNKLNSKLKETVSSWKALSEEEREGAFGQDVLQEIIDMKTQLAALDNQLKLHVTNLTEVQKAEQRLQFLRSEEGQKLIELKKQISELTSSHRVATPAIDEAAIDEVTKAYEKYRYAISDTNAQVQEYNVLTERANREAKLTAKLNQSEIGSYDQLSAQYELNIIKLNAMSHEMRYATEEGKDLEEQTLNIYKQMIGMQEATGNYKLSVGNYKLAWNGLSNAMNQLIREMPAATVSINTFFLAISNNIPVLIDEIERVRQKNKLLQAEGKETVSVGKTIAKSIFSWQTALIILLTALSAHGKEMLEWIKKQIQGHKVTKTTTQLIKDMNKELEKTNDSYGQNIATVKKLSNEWKQLTTKNEQLKWIEDNKTEFDKLDVSIENVNDAENLFVDNTESMIESLRLRAKAAAAMKLATEKYEKALLKQLKAEQREYNYERVVDPETGAVTIKKTAKEKKASDWQTLGASALLEIGAANAGPGPATMSEVQRNTERIAETAEAYADKHIQNLKDEADAAELDGDALMELAGAFDAEAAARLKNANIKTNGRGGRTGRDLTDQIWRNDLSIRKKYELSLSELQRDEFKKRRIEAVDQANQTIREMQEKFRQNEAFLTNAGGKYKELTPEQRAQIEQQQKEINAIIENTRRKLEIDLVDLEYEYEVDSNNKLRQAMDFRLDIIKDNLEEEKQLRLKQIDEREKAYKTTGITTDGETTITGEMSPEQIAEFNRERERIIAEYDSIIYNMRAKDIQAQLELVKKGSDEELAILLQQNEVARQLALAQNRLRPVEERQSESQINAQFGKRGAQIKGQTQMINFDQAQAATEAEFNIVKHNEREITIFKLTAERDRWNEMIRLAKEGAIEWSDEQLKEAEATVQGIERKLDELNSFWNLIGEKGLGGALLTKLGFDDDQIAALTEAANIIIDNIKSILDAEVEAAEKAVELSEKRVDAAQSAYEAEVEARSKGYANNVASSKKELQLEKKNQMQKQQILEEAQRKQEAVNTAVQASSLITASAQLWSSFAGAGFLGPVLALAAIATMWTSFAMAKMKAAELSKASQQYGEGGFEFLEGGSHASGNDIDLHTTNSRGRNMRAEGGESMAIFNRRSTRRYHKALPQLVDSINKGTFEDKFSRVFSSGDELSRNVIYQQKSTDLTRLEDDVRALKKNSERQFVIMPDGSYIEIKKNVTRIVH